MRKAILAASVAALVLLAMSAGTASADHATHFTFSFSNQHFFPAGTQCDFNFQDTFTVDGNGINNPNGTAPLNLTEYVTHTNLDTGYSLTEVDHIEVIGQANSSTTINAGIFWHLREANGQTVLVRAGSATFDSTTGQLISFTPNSAQNLTNAQVICPALGGSAI